MAREAFEFKDRLSTTEKEEKLKKNDATFTNKDPDFGRDIDDFEDIEPERKYTVRGFCPDYKENLHPLVEIMSQLKMKKNEYFYKIFKYALEVPIYIILRLIERANYFPKSMRDSKLTFLASGRAIFSLEALTKIIEVCLSSSFNDCLQEHYKIHGDPMQMAYEPSRGTTSNNLITFSLCDIVLFKTNKPIAQTFADLVKAFNMANRTVMLKEIQRIAGAGRLCRSRFEGRVYSFEGEKRGLRFNRGVDPGSPVSVFLFKLFMNTDVSLSGLNKNLIWAAAYSDDRAPIIPADDYITGSAQYIWNQSEKWADDNKVEYHVEKDDKKKHSYIEYKRKNMPETIEMNELKLKNKTFTKKTSERELGLNVTTSFSTTEQKNIVNKYGYRFSPEIGRAKRMAYRFQYLKDWFPPKFLRQMVMSYFCGVIRFGACLYWSRSTRTELDELRFYYTMAASSILGLNAYDILGGCCCKNMTVAQGNKDYLRMLEVTDLPTVEKMALIDSVSAVRQVSELVPEFFSNTVVCDNSDRFRMRDVMGFGTGRKRRLRRTVVHYGDVENDKIWRNTSKKVSEAGLPSELSQIVVNSDALIGDVWRLACRQVDENNKVGIFTHRKFEQFYEISIEYCTNNKEVNYLRAMEEYKILCKDEFKLIEVQERRLAFKTPTKVLVADTQCKSVPPVWEVPARKKKIMSCRTKPPMVVNSPVGAEYLDLNLQCCLVCGYYVLPNIIMNGNRKIVQYKEGECGTCKRKIHKKCIAGLFIKVKSFRCCLVKYHLGKDGGNIFGPVDTTSLSSVPAKSCSNCLVCGSSIVNYSDNVMCSKNCSYGTHLECAKVLFDMKTTSSSSLESFKCSDVIYQLKEDEVKVGIKGNKKEKDLLYKKVKTRGRVGSSTYSKKRKRWLNDEIECAFCGRWYSTEENNHLEVYCTGMFGESLTDSNKFYPFSRLKRFRHLTRKVP